MNVYVRSLTSIYKRVWLRFRLGSSVFQHWPRVSRRLRNVFPNFHSARKESILLSLSLSLSLSFSLTVSLSLVSSRRATDAHCLSLSRSRTHVPGSRVFRWYVAQWDLRKVPRYKTPCDSEGEMGCVALAIIAENPSLGGVPEFVDTPSTTRRRFTMAKFRKRLDQRRTKIKSRREEARNFEYFRNFQVAC